MSDTISRRTAIEACESIKRSAIIEDGEPLVRKSAVKYVLDNLPSAEPQIIQCKDCKWWTNQSTTLQGKCRLHNLNPMPEWYCASGEED